MALTSISAVKAKWQANDCSTLAPINGPQACIIRAMLAQSTYKANQILRGSSEHCGSIPFPSKSKENKTLQHFGAWPHSLQPPGTYEVFEPIFWTRKCRSACVGMQGAWLGSLCCQAEPCLAAV